MLIYLYLLCTTGILCANSQNVYNTHEKVSDSSIVTTANGKVQGYSQKSPGNVEYYVFYEIPFASPPVGVNRFQVPVVPNNWTGVLDVANISKICPQGPSPENMVGTEDCLYLNVYTPVKPGSTNESLPVLAYIFGGAFQRGSTQPYNAKYYMDYGVIVVTLNYRLGIFGFLTTEDGVIPGNLGLRDQQFALKWIAKNIRAFGGDPTKVTINGVSAGSASVSYHMVGNGNEGLFIAGIMESGSSLGAHELQKSARSNAFAVGRQLNIQTDNSTELLKALQTQDTRKIFEAGQTVAYEKEEPEIVLYDNTIWLPVLESTNINNGFITKPMHEAFMTGNFITVPTIAGFNSEESLYYLNKQQATEKSIKADNHLTVVIDTRCNVDESNKTIAGSEMRKVYTAGLFQDDVGSFMKYLSDKQYTTPTIRQAKYASKYSSVYLYEFGYLFNGQGISTIPGTEGGVQHGSQVIYFWNYYPQNIPLNLTREDERTRTRLLTMWTNFMKYLNPTPVEKSDNLPQWPKLTENKLLYLSINTTLEVRVNARNYETTEAVLEKYIEPPYIVF